MSTKRSKELDPVEVLMMKRGVFEEALNAEPYSSTDLTKAFGDYEKSISQAASQIDLTSEFSQAEALSEKGRELSARIGDMATSAFFSSKYLSIKSFIEIISARASTEPAPTNTEAKNMSQAKSPI